MDQIIEALRRKQERKRIYRRMAESDTSATIVVYGHTARRAVVVDSEGQVHTLGRYLDLITDKPEQQQPID